MTAEQVERRLRELADDKIATIARRFFKTGPGQYAEGDQFLGIKVPQVRKVEREFQGLPVVEAEALLRSPLHECRQLALLLLVRLFTRGNDATQKGIYTLYLRNTAHINNWDLVDCSAEPIVGGYLRERDRKPLYRLARSKSLWERRISIIATYHFIKRRDFADTFGIVTQLLADKEDLIHKAVGWMLREVGKRDLQAEIAFLAEHYRDLPRTALRYAIERFPEEQLRQYLKGEI